MLRAAAVLVVTIAAALPTAPAHAAKSYDDPWLEGDLAQMRVPQALDILARTPRHVVVADVDSGARLNDADLAPHLLQMSMPYTCADEYGPGPAYAADPADGDFGCDFIGSGVEYSSPTSPQTTIPDGDPSDPFGHGTGTAEIIAGVPDNGIEGAGVAPNARVLPVRACYGGNPDCYAEPTVDGFEYAIDMGAQVVNASWQPDESDSSAFRSVIHSHPDVLFAFAIAGSGQNDQPYAVCTDKADYPNVICVGVANADDTPGTVDADLTTDVSAPGYAGVPDKDGKRREFGSTASATAHVSGAAALLRGIDPDLLPSTIRNVLVTTSRPVPGYATANMAGGIVDVAAAVRKVESLAGQTTPAEGHGAPADDPDPFPSAAPPAGGGSGSTGSTASNGVPGAGAPGTPATPVAPGRPASAAKAPTLSVNKLPRSVRAGGTLTVHVRVSGGTGTVAAKLTHGKKTLAHASGRVRGGSATVKLRLSRRARTGRARLTVRLTGAKALVRSVTVARRRS